MNRLAGVAGMIVGYLAGIVATLIFSITILGYAVQFRDDDATLRTFFTGHHTPVSIGYYTSHNRTLRFLKAGEESRPATLVFVHGAPSSMSYFRNFYGNDTLLQQASMLAVDRPGYGYSGLGDPEPSLERQSAMIRPLLDSLRSVRHPLILVGVSYGTTVACRLAMDNPGLVDGLVLVAPSMAPGEERIFPISYLMQEPWLKWLVPPMLRSANAEKLQHRAELTKMLRLWKGIRVPVIYLQGTNDGLIYTTNAAFAKSHLVNAASLRVTMIPGRGHLITFSEKDLITHAIYDMLKLARDYRH